MNISKPSLSSINDLLEARYGLRVEPATAEEATFILEVYGSRRSRLLRESGEAVVCQSEDYAKSLLICEAARIALREIAPKRMKRKKNR